VPVLISAKSAIERLTGIAILDHFLNL
jgi:hypothetical protein